MLPQERVGYDKISIPLGRQVMSMTYGKHSLMVPQERVRCGKMLFRNAQSDTTGHDIRCGCIACNWSVVLFQRGPN